MAYKPNHKYMLEAIRQSQLAVERGSYPYGAVLVHEDEIILSAHNMVLIEHDITAHAELTLVREASKKFSPEILLNSVIYTSTESCAMCAGAIYWAGIPTVVFGCATAVDGALSAEPFAVRNSEIFREVGHPVELIGPFMQEEALKVLKPFWAAFLKTRKQKIGTV